MPEPRVPRFKAVLLDFGGTLDADGEPSVEQFLRAYRAAGGRLDAGEFETIFRESDRQLAADPATRTRGFRDSIAAQSRLLAALVADADHVEPSVIANGVHAAARSIAARNAGILRALHHRGIRTGVISNFTGNLDRCLDELGLAPHVDVAIDSTVVGIRKPDPAIFALALAQLGVEPACALMVGDNPFADIRPAAAIGMATCWLAPLTRPIPDGCVPTFRIAVLSELVVQLEHTPDSALVGPCTG